MKTKDQAEVLRAAREKLGKTNAELAAELGVSEPTVVSWLAPEDAKRRRAMPKAAMLLLDRILKEHREKQRGR